MRFAFDDHVLDCDRRELRRAGTQVAVEPQVFDLLAHLIRNRDRVVGKDELLEVVWGGRIVSESTLFTRINAARAAIGDNGERQELIRTVPRKGLRFVGAAREEGARPSGPTSVTGAATAAVAAPDMADRASIAVLRFANLGASAGGDDYLSDGIAGDIITELSRFSELAVISRNSSFRFKDRAIDIREVGRELGVRYVLDGSIAQAGGRVRISAQLVDATTGAHRWAERYERRLDDVFQLQEEVARTIVATLAVRLGKAEAARTLTKSPATWQAHDHYLRAADTYAQWYGSYAPAKLYETRAHLERALAQDEGYARAYDLLSRTWMSAWVNPTDTDHLNPAALDRAHELALRAVRLDPNLPQAHAALGYALTYKHQHEDALAEYARAFALNPSFTDWTLALAQVYAGEPAQAVETVRTLARLDPFHPPVALGFLGFAHYMLEQYEAALPPLRDCTRRAPDFRGGHFWLAATYARLGREQEARAAAAEVLRIEPDYTISRSAAPLAAFRRDADLRHWMDGLRAAGLPE